MTSHELADQLIETAKLLKERPSFEAGNTYLHSAYYGSKEPFLAGVRALVLGKKEVTDYNVFFKPKGMLLQLVIDRSSVCKWECEPLLSNEEEESLST